MYERVRRDAPPRRVADWRLICAVAACGVFLAVMTGLIVWFGSYLGRFRGFLNDLAESAVYTYDHGVALLEAGERVVPLGDTSALTLAIQGAGAGRVVPVPEAEPDAVVTFADGARLALWAVELEGYEHQWSPGGPEPDWDAPIDGTVVCYTDSGGAVYCYDTDELQLEPLLRTLVH